MKSSRGAKRTVVLCLLVVGISTAAAFGLRELQTGPQGPTDAQQYAANQQMLSALRSQVSTKFASEGFSASAQGWAAENSPYGTAESVPGYSFKVSTTIEPTIEFLNNDPQQHSLADAVTYIADTLRSQDGFVDDKTQPTQPADIYSPDMTATSFALVRGTAACGMNWDTYTLSVTCGSPAVDQHIAAQIAPLVAAYTQVQHVQASALTVIASSIKSKDPNASHEVITRSETSGYDIAELVVQQGSSKPQVALYYAKNGVWHFVTKHSDEYGFSCDDMKANPDARQALYDQVCYQYPSTGQVRLDSSRPAL